MIRPLAVLLCLIVASAAQAVTRVTIDPAPPFHADERVSVRLDLDVTDWGKRIEVTGDNINLIRQGDDMNATQFWSGSFFSTSGWGEIVVRAPMRIEGPTRIPFTILPPLMQPWTDPAAEVRRLIAANRPPVIVSAQLLTPNPVVGQRVKVVWYLYHPFEGPTYSLSVDSDDRSKARTFGGDFPPPPEVLESLGGIMFWRSVAGTTTLTPRQPGRVTIPALKFSSGNMTRLASALEFDVKPIPSDAAGLPVGPFTVECRDSDSLGYWPQLRVDVRGEGNLDDVHDFRFPRTSYAVITRQLETAWSNERRFAVAAHSRTIVEMPKPTLRYFDPATNRPREVTCTRRILATMAKTPLRTDLRPLLHDPQTIRFDEVLRPLAQNRNPATSNPGSVEFLAIVSQLRNVSFILAAAGLLGLVFALRVR